MIKSLIRILPVAAMYNLKATFEGSGIERFERSA